MSRSYSLAHVCPEREVQLTENISHTVLPLISAALKQECRPEFKHNWASAHGVKLSYLIIKGDSTILNQLL